MERQLRLRRLSPINREFSIYEIVDQDEALLDVARNDSGEYEIAFHAACSGTVLSLDNVKALIAEAETLLAKESGHVEAGPLAGSAPCRF